MRRHTCLLILIFSAAGLLRLYKLTCGSIWLDEGYTAFFSQQGLSDLLRSAAADSNPPLGTLLFMGWLQLWGLSELSLELFAVVFGVLSLYPMYRLGDRLGTKRVGLTAVALLAASPYHIHFSQQARVYTVALFLLLLTTEQLLNYMKNGRLRSLIAVGAGFITLLYLHYYFVFVLASLLVWAFAQALRESNTKRFWQLLMLSLGICLAFVPGMWWIYQQMGGAYNDLSWLKLPDAVSVLEMLLWVGSGSAILLLCVLAAIAYACENLISGRMEGENRASEIWLLICWAGIPFFGSILVSFLVRPIFHEKYIFFTYPAYLLIFSWALHRAFPRLRDALLLLLVVALTTIPSVQEYYNRVCATQEKKALYFSIANTIQPTVAIAHSSVATYLESQFYRQYAGNEFILAEAGEKGALEDFTDREVTLGANELKARFSRVWFLHFNEFPDEFLAMLREQGWKREEKRSAEGLEAQLWLSNAGPGNNS